MKNCLIVKGGSVTGLRTSGVTYMFPEPIAFDMLERKGSAFIKAFETNPVEAMEMVGVKIEGAVENITDASKFTNHSGGAVGSDTEWDNIGREFGMINNKHYWTETKTPNGNTEISQEDFQEGRFESAKAAKRNFGYQYNTMKDSRLIRNWSQVKNSDAIFAIGKIVRTGEKMFPNQANDDRIAQVPSVTGGTGYAVGMGINNNKPVFVFNQTKGSYDIGWYKWDVNVNDFVKIETPKLSKNFAGIGTREINDAGKKAIREVYTKTFNTVQETNEDILTTSVSSKERKESDSQQENKNNDDDLDDDDNLSEEYEKDVADYFESKPLEPEPIVEKIVLNKTEELPEIKIVVNKIEELPVKSKDVNNKTEELPEIEVVATNAETSENVNPLLLPVIKETERFTEEELQSDEEQKEEINDKLNEKETLETKKNNEKIDLTPVSFKGKNKYKPEAQLVNTIVRLELSKTTIAEQNKLAKVGDLGRIVDEIQSFVLNKMIGKGITVAQRTLYSISDVFRKIVNNAIRNIKALFSKNNLRNATFLALIGSNLSLANKDGSTIDVYSMIKYAGIKYGIIELKADVVEESNNKSTLEMAAKTSSSYVKKENKVNANSKIVIPTGFQVIGKVRDNVSSNSTDSLLSYRNQWIADDGFVFFITSNRKNASDDKTRTWNNVEGVGHFVIDTDMSGRNATMYINPEGRPNEYFPVFIKDNTNEFAYKMIYKKGKDVDLKKDKVVTPLVQFKLSNINWKDSRKIYKSSKEFYTFDGKPTGFLFKDENVYGRFNGNSVVFIFEYKGKTVVRDFAGSISQIKKEAESIKSDYNLTADDIVIGRYDAGSFSAKPAAKKGKLDRNQWNSFNLNDGGSAMMIPSPNKTNYSKFDTESNPTQDFKDLIQSLSDKLGVPVKYDNNLPYAGAFIDGNVVLNPSKMDETTVWHEFAHPFVQAVRKQNKPLYDNLVNEIYNTPHGKALLKEVQSLYGEKNQKIQEEEVIVELIARYASGKIDGFTAKKYKSIWDKIKDFIRSIGKIMFKNNNVVDTSAVNVFTMNPDMSIKDLSKVLKHSEIVWFSEKEEDFNNYDRKLLNLQNVFYFAKKSVEDKKNEIEAYKNEPNYKIDSANKFLKTLEEEVLRIEKELLSLKEEKGKGFKTNQQTVEDLKGVYHNIGAYMNNAGISTIKESVSNIVDLLKAGKKIELAAWNGRGSSLMAGDILLSFKPQAIVKDTYVKDAFTELSESDSEGNRERFSPNTHLRDNDSSKKIDSFDYSESIMALNKTNLRSIWILQNDSDTESGLSNLKELSDLTGAPIINKATKEIIYTPENKVEYQPEIYESRFGNKDINKESPEAIYKEVEEVFIKMRLDDSSQHTFEKIQSFEEFVGSIFENTNDASKFNVAKMLIKTPNYNNYLLNKSKFQIELMKRNLMYETDTNKIDVFNAIINVLESKISIFEIVNNNNNIELMSTIKDDIKRAHEDNLGAFALGVSSILFPLINETVFEGVFPYVNTLGIAGLAFLGVSFAGGPIVSTFKYVKNAVSNFFTNRRNKIVKGLENKFTIESLMKKKDIDLYIKILKNKMSKDGDNPAIDKLISNLESIKSKLDLINSNMAVLTNNKYQSYMNDLLRAYGDKKYTHDNLVDAMIDKVRSGEFVPKFVMNYAVQSGLTVENNSINRALFAERLLNFLEAYETENLRSTPADLNDLLGDYNINQVLEPERYKNQTKLANNMNKTKSDVIGKKNASKDLSTLSRSELESLIDSGDSLYVDTAKRMLYALNEKEALAGKSTHKKDSELNDGKTKLNDRSSKLSRLEFDLKIHMIKILKKNIKTNRGYISDIEKLLENVNFIIERENDRTLEDFEKRRNNLKKDIQNWEARIKKESGEITGLLVELLKSILSDYGISYDSFSPQLKSQIETKLTNNPELLNDSNFIKSLTC